MNASDTSLESYGMIVENERIQERACKESLRDKIFAFILEQPGYTSGEIHVLLKLECHISTTRARITELFDDEKVRIRSRRKCTQSGRRCKTWEVWNDN